MEECIPAEYVLKNCCVILVELMFRVRALAATTARVFPRHRVGARRRLAVAAEAAKGGSPEMPTSSLPTLLRGTVGGLFFYGGAWLYESYGQEYTGASLPLEPQRAVFGGIALFYAARLPGNGIRRLVGSVAALAYGVGCVGVNAIDGQKEPSEEEQSTRASSTRRTPIQWTDARDESLVGVATTIPFYFLCKNARAFTKRNVAGSILLLGAVAAEFVCRIRSTETRPFWKTMFAYSRHPDVFFEWLTWASIPVLGGGWYSILHATGMLGNALYARVPVLDRAGEERDGNEYRKYERTTSGFLPIPKFHKEISQKKLYTSQDHLPDAAFDSNRIRGSWVVEFSEQPFWMGTIFAGRYQVGSSVAISKCPPEKEHGNLIFSLDNGARTFRAVGFGKDGERSKFRVEPWVAPSGDASPDSVGKNWAEFVHFATHFPKAWVNADSYIVGPKELYFCALGSVDEEEYLVVIDGDRTDLAVVLSRSGHLRSTPAGERAYITIIEDLRRRGFLVK